MSTGYNKYRDIESYGAFTILDVQHCVSMEQKSTYPKQGCTVSCLSVSLLG